jgi:hypothetical protein
MAVLELAGHHVGHGDASSTVGDRFRDRDVAFPPPMLVPDQVHFFNGDALRLRHEEEDERLHDDHPGGEEEEDAPLEGAQHRQEHLGDEEREKQVGAHCDTLPRRPRLQRKNLTRNEPPEWPPRPCER